MRSILSTLALVAACVHAVFAQAAPPAPVAPEGPGPKAVSRTGLISAVSRDRLRAFHEIAAESPHPAGSEADLALAARFAELFESFGAEVEVHEIWPCLAFPRRAALTLLAPERRDLPVAERVLPDDPDSGHAELGIGWNAYSASGRAEGEVVYVNYGRKEDFARLAELGVECRGKIVLARYGGNYRGYKWKFAEEAGAAGLVIFTDPADSGWRRGLSWPEGGWANGSSIQRGSILTLPHAGDPLTPGRSASRDAKRLPDEAVAFPRIPVQPVGWDAAREILVRMRGPEVPSAWQGGLPFRYRLSGGPELKLRVEVEQERKLARTCNVLATIPARDAEAPFVIFGSHHDAWTFGAGDPAAGVMTVLEAARIFGEAARSGWRPEVGLVFALWGAEEHGIIGSTEWVESREEELRARCLAYVNLDMAAMGLDLGAAASPSLKDALARAASEVPDPRDPKASVLGSWRARGTDPDDEGLPRTGVLGGGSDHVAFLARCGVACAAISAGGSNGSSYHSNYDDLLWYRRIVGDDYRSGELVTRMVVSLAWEFATAPAAILRPSRQGPAARRHLAELAELARRRGLLEDETVARDYAALEAKFAALEASLREVETRAATAHPDLSAPERHALLGDLLTFDRAWLDAAGLPARPWYRNLYAAPDEDSGYAAWMLPALRRTVEKGNAEELALTLERYARVADRLREAARALRLRLETMKSD